MLNVDQIQDFQKDGFLLGDRILDDDQVEELREELDRVIAEGPEEPDLSQSKATRIANLGGNPDTPVWQIVNMWQASETFRDLTFHPVIVEEVAQLLNAEELRVWHDQVQYKPSGVGGITGWHQDSPAWPNIAPKTTQISSWVALDDVDESNGCMSMIQGSHKWGVCGHFLHQIRSQMTSFQDVPKSFENQELHVVLRPVKKGYVHYHHALTVHGSHQNTSDRKRRAIANHYMTENTVYDETGGHLMKPFVTVSHGDKLVGDVFPLVWQKDREV